MPIHQATICVQVGKKNMNLSINQCQKIVVQSIVVLGTFSIIPSGKK